MPNWPRDNVTDLIAFYGDPARDAVEPQLVKVIPPFRMTYDGKVLSHLMFHRLAAPALERALNRVWDYYGRDQAKVDALGISKTAGTYNKRFISGTTRWSNHAFGAAIDINAEENGFNMAGNIPVPMVAAFKAEGARWGGDYRGRTDPMHFEFCQSGEPARTFEQWLAFYGEPSGAAQQPTRSSMRFTNITATVFGGPSDSMSGTQTAYGDVKGDWWNRPGVALPARFEGVRPRVRVTHQGRSVDCEIIDQGPWNYTSAQKGLRGDPYWITGTRPQAESGRDLTGRITNKAGIDLTPAAANAIGLQGKGLVDWDFADHLGAINGDVLDPLSKSDAAAPAGNTLLPLLLLLLLTKEKTPMTDQPSAGQAPDLMKVLLPLILQSVVSGKPINANDLLPVLLQGILGVPLALPAPAPSPEPATPPVTAPSSPQNINDMLLPLLLQALTGKPAAQPEAKPEPPAAAVVPAPATGVAPADRGIASAGFLGLIGAVLGQLTGVMPTVGEGASMVGPTVTAASLLATAGGALGAISPTLGVIARIAGAIFGAISNKK